MSITTITPASVVAPPARTPLPLGLFSVLSFRGNGDRWEGGGVTWVGDTCGPADGIGAWNCAPLDDEGATVGLPKRLEEGNTTGEASQFTIYGHWTCSPIGTSDTEARDRAQRHLIAREEARVEQALWTGDLGNVPNFAGANGYAAPTALSGAGDVLEAIGSLEDWIAAEYGSQGILHMTRSMALRAIKDAGAEVRGGRLYTALGTPIVAGSGYAQGTGGPSESTIVATGAMFGYRSEIFDGGSPILDRGENNLTAVAERNYLVALDECGLASVTVGGAEE